MRHSVHGGDGSCRMLTMRLWQAILIVIAALVIVVGCKSGNSPAGVYRIEQDGGFFGEGAEKFELELKNDQSFEFGVGNLSMGKGTWSSSADRVKLNWTQGTLGGGKAGVDYQIQPGKLIPLTTDGKPISKWRFVRK